MRTKDEKGFGLSSDTTQIRRVLAAARQTWYRAALDCALCGRCAPRCGIYDQEGAGRDGQSFAARAGLGFLASFAQDAPGLAACADFQTALRDFLSADPELYRYLRSCCLCDHCTAWCPSGLTATATVKAWRRLMALSGILREADSKSVLVDQEWHIFSVYRAVYGISYSEFPDLATVGPGQVDTVFFPGCSLVSYAPELTRRVGQWLTGAGLRWALCSDCCGSPLVSAGLAERSLALRRRILGQCLEAGVKRIVTVCSGCAEELAAVCAGQVEIIALPELLWQRRDSAASVLSPAKSHPDPAVYAIHDSCHDRAGTSGRPLRQLLAARGLGELRELECSCRNTSCCGAGGAVSAFDPALSRRRAEDVMRAASERGADVLVTSCPTCSYTMAQYALDAPAGSPFKTVRCKHYLELLFGQAIDWNKVFAQLGGMWTGEYGAWVAEQLG